MKAPDHLEQLLRAKGAAMKEALSPAKNASSVEKLAAVAVIGLSWFLEKAIAELNEPKL